MTHARYNRVTRWMIWGLFGAGMGLVYTLSHHGVIARASTGRASECATWAQAHGDVELLEVCERGASLREILDLMNSRRTVHVRAE